MNIEKILAPDARVVLVSSESHRYCTILSLYTRDLFRERNSVFCKGFLELPLYHPILLHGGSSMINHEKKESYTNCSFLRHVSWDFTHQLSPTEEMVSLPKHEYTSIRAYNISKLCGIHFMHYLAYRWLKTDKTVFCAHPGSFIKTRLCRNWWPYEALYTIMLPFSKTIVSNSILIKQNTFKVN